MGVRGQSRATPRVGGGPESEATHSKSRSSSCEGPMPALFNVKREPLSEVGERRLGAESGGSFSLPKPHWQRHLPREWVPWLTPPNVSGGIRSLHTSKPKTMTRREARPSVRNLCHFHSPPSSPRLTGPGDPPAAQGSQPSCPGGDGPDWTSRLDPHGAALLPDLSFSSTR